MTAHRIIASLLTTCALGGLAGAASAQTATSATATPEVPAADVPNSADIVVTARRVQERLQDVPISITVFNQQQLANRNIVNTADLATYTPSLSVNSRYGSEKASFAIRGFNQELNTAPTVGVYFADVVAPRSQGSTTGGNGTTPGALFDLQNIQVLKGPQGTLQGRNTTGGAVLIVPQKPTSRLEGFVEGSYGNYDLKRVQAVLNAPLSDRARLRLGVDREDRDGYLRNRSGVGPKDFADINYTALRASLVVDLTPDLENYTIAAYTHSRTHGSLPRLVTCAPNAAALPAVTQQQLAPLGCAQLIRQTARGDGYYDVENSVADPFIKLDQWQVINTTTWKASDTLTIRNIASYAQVTEVDSFNIEGDNLFSNGNPLHFAVIHPGPSGVGADQSTFTEELQVQGRTPNGRLTYQVGGYLELSDPLNNQTQLTDIFMNCTDIAANQCLRLPGILGALGRVSLNDYRYTFHDWAFYGQATYKLTDRLSLTGGIRYTHDLTRGIGANAFATFAPGTNAPTFACTKVFSAPGVNLRIPSYGDRSVCREEISQVSAKPTWLADVDFKPTDDVLLYAKYARGYRQGSVSLTPTGRNFESVEAEKVDLYEVGAKTSFRGTVSGTFNVTAFWNDFTNQQINANLIAKAGQGVGGVVPVNAGKSRIRGVEVEASVALPAGFRVDASYTYLDAKLKSIVLPTLTAADIYSAIIPTASAGQPLAFSPKNKGTVTGTYTLPLPPHVGRVSVAATYTHTDKQFASRADDAYVGIIGYNPGQLPATDLLNLNLNWNGVAGLPVDLSLFATNVTGKKYWVALTNAFGTAGYETLILGEPRMYGARLRYRFGR